MASHPRLEIEGCIAWQREGLNPPPAVRDATTAYLDAQDALAAWIEESCEWDAEGFDASVTVQLVDGVGHIIRRARRYPVPVPRGAGGARVRSREAKRHPWLQGFESYSETRGPALDRPVGKVLKKANENNEGALGALFSIDRQMRTRAHARVDADRG